MFLFNEPSSGTTLQKPKKKTHTHTHTQVHLQYALLVNNISSQIFIKIYRMFLALQNQIFVPYETSTLLCFFRCL